MAPNFVSEAQAKDAYRKGRMSVYLGNDGKECPFTHPTLAAAWRRGRFEMLTK